ncbi:hypothetical protein [Streptomyces jumonjinensis]|uniref:hypothetical protein n=1 Tax=Streptomyces jumonjinensis TaxID=1945 RepID=UPI0037A85E61
MPHTPSPAAAPHGAPAERAGTPDTPPPPRARPRAMTEEEILGAQRSRYAQMPDETWLAPGPGLPPEIPRGPYVKATPALLAEVAEGLRALQKEAAECELGPAPVPGCVICAAYEALRASAVAGGRPVGIASANEGIRRHPHRTGGAG